MTSIDWTRDDVQHLAAALDDVEILAFLEAAEQREAAFYDRLRDTLASLPNPTARQLAAMWIADTWWRIREALHVARLYP